MFELVYFSISINFAFLNIQYLESVVQLFSPQGEGVSYRGRLLMAVQAEFGESASESGIRQVEVEPTAPISDVSNSRVVVFSVEVIVKEIKNFS